MKILQLNIWGGKLGKQIIELLNREQADIVCLQEVVELKGGDSFFVTTLAEIASATEYPYVFFSSSFSFKHMNRKALWGNAILSKTPFVTEDAFFTRGAFSDDFDTQGGDYNMRILQRVLIEIDGRQVHILNHHGHHLDEHKRGDEETVRQCKMIVDYVNKLEGNVVLAGDFNLTPDSESLEQINAVLKNHCIENKITTTRTSLTYKVEVCDYIFTSAGLTTKNFEVSDDIVSDHSALCIELV